jgi:hypothetical protein
VSSAGTNHRATSKQPEIRLARLRRTPNTLTECRGARIREHVDDDVVSDDSRSSVGISSVGLIGRAAAFEERELPETVLIEHGASGLALVMRGRFPKLVTSQGRVPGGSKLLSSGPLLVCCLMPRLC